jgi:hypothetical protein
MSVVACADSFAFCMSAWPDTAWPCWLSSAPAVLGARNRAALANAINKRSFMSRLLESGAAALIPFKKELIREKTSCHEIELTHCRTDKRANAYAGLLRRVTELNE